MTERYTKLFSVEEATDNPKVPLKVIAGAVYHDSVTYKTLIQLKFRNESDYIIESFKINVLLFNKSGEKINTEVSHAYQSVNKGKGAEFGDSEPVVASYIDDLGSVQINIMDVAFADGTEWILGQDISERRQQEIDEIVKNAVQSINNEDPRRGLEIYCSLPDDYEKKAELIEYAKEAIKEKDYRDALRLKDKATTENDFIAAAKAFEKLDGYKDSAALQSDCLETGETVRAQNVENEYLSASQAMDKAKSEKEFKDIENRLVKLDGYKDSDILLAECRKEIEQCQNNEKYNSALTMMSSNEKSQMLKALDYFKELDDWRDSKEQIKKCESALYQSEKKRRIVITSVLLVIMVVAGSIFGINKYLENKKMEEMEKARAAKLEEMEKARSAIEEYQGVISATEDYTVAVKKDGSVVSTKIKDGTKDEVMCRDEVDDLEDVVSVAASEYDTYAVFSNGKVYDSYSKYKKEESPSDIWKDIVSVSAAEWHTLGLTKDGILRCAYNEDHDVGQSDVEDWQNIVGISAGDYHSVGLMDDGTVISTKITDEEYDYGQTKVGEWKNTIAISAGTYHTVGLKKDGTVVSTKITDEYNDTGQTKVEKWKDIVAISAGPHHTVGLKKDGTVVSTKITDENKDFGQTKVDKWKDIVAISAGLNHTVGLKKDGTVVSTKITDDDYDYGQTEVEDWKDII